jgi:hypothetical protein
MLYYFFFAGGGGMAGQDITERKENIYSKGIS